MHVCHGNDHSKINARLSSDSVVEKMLSQFANSNTKPANWKEYDGATPLHAACENSHPQIVEKLIEKGANITATSVESSKTYCMI